jgi:hypothetical protein
MSLFLNILVFLIFTVLLFGSGKVAQLLNDDKKLVISSVLFASMLFAVLQITNKSSEGFFFEVTPAKRCCGGPYMYSSDPERQELCSKISPEELSRACCGNGYVGRPMRSTGCKGSMNQIVNETSY